ncbi:hypothetical protein [Ureibacillus aquaedulcis]|uniref:Uncharacterized protein n=1 Tax=Ureibacillus aquaedulcis TaxID=3058421 RepID=A0ABT8GMR5_9BACL|nr:hypothetical protein [Ureibacillus sp. BA0131]MDN4492700.1 hypothetical protein [Ureibacillus sp. BA0131]
MKKVLASLLSGIFFLAIYTTAFAAENRPTILYFGVEAVVNEGLEGEYIVKTKGGQTEEGFVFTPPKPFTNENLKFLITIKGKGIVILKVEETNARGQYIKEGKLEIELTPEWTTHEMTFTLESPSSQVDTSVLTKNKEKAEFSFKNLQVIEE